MFTGEVLDGRYRLETSIGAGGMADVFVAYDLRLDRPVAIKTVRDADPIEHDRFDAEVSLLARLTHRNLIQIYDAGTHDGRPYMVMALIDGHSLDHDLHGVPLPASTVYEIGVGVASALAYIAAEGIVHRDVKPSNVLIENTGRVVLGDFGIARLADTTRLTQAAMTIGTAAYMAPEQVTGRDVGPPADVYALGLILLECLTGTRAFPGPAHESALARLARNPDIPESVGGWAQLLSEMTAQDPAIRPPAVAVLARLSEDPSASAETLAIIPIPVEMAEATSLATASGMSAWVRRQRPGVLITAGAIALIVLAALIGVALHRNPKGVVPPATTSTSFTTLSTAAPTTVATTAPPTTTNCAGLRAQRQAIDVQQRSIDQQVTNPQLRDQMHKALDAQKRALDSALRGCP
ncbi:MAG: hypothetical protein NVS3B21_30590 [Acidimicrobiales bacterium]